MATGAAHLTIKCIHKQHIQAHHQDPLIFISKSPHKQDLQKKLLAYYSTQTAAAIREALNLKLDWRHKFKLLPFKHNERPPTLPLSHFIQYP